MIANITYNVTSGIIHHTIDINLYNANKGFTTLYYIVLTIGYLFFGYMAYLKRYKENIYNEILYLRIAFLIFIICILYSIGINNFYYLNNIIWGVASDTAFNVLQFMLAFVNITYFIMWAMIERYKTEN